MGERAVGVSLSLISPAEDRAHAKVLEALEIGFEHVDMDGRLLRSAQERVNLATKIVEAEEKEQSTRRKNLWFQEKADEAGLELDDMMDENFQEDGKRERHKSREAEKARSLLDVLLCQPMKTQRFGKFLATNSSQHPMQLFNPPSLLSASKKHTKKRQRRSR